jgi:uncharacterized protein DUF5676
MIGRSPWRTGFALSLTIAIGYSACASLYALWPSQGVDLLNAIFHGLNFHKLEPSEPFTFGMFLYPLLVFVVWGFLVGTLFAWLHHLIQGEIG